MGTGLPLCSTCRYWHLTQRSAFSFSLAGYRLDGADECRIYENQHLLDATEIFRKLNVHKKVCFFVSGLQASRMWLIGAGIVHQTGLPPLDVLLLPVQYDCGPDPRRIALNSLTQEIRPRDAQRPVSGPCVMGGVILTLVSGGIKNTLCLATIPACLLRYSADCCRLARVRQEP